RTFGKLARCFWARSSNRSKSFRCKLFQLDSRRRDHSISSSIEKRTRIYIGTAIGQPVHHRAVRVRHDDQRDIAAFAEEIRGAAPLGGSSAVEDGAILRVVGEVAGEEI